MDVSAEKEKPEEHPEQHLAHIGALFKNSLRIEVSKIGMDTVQGACGNPWGTGSKWEKACLDFCMGEWGMGHCWVCDKLKWEHLPAVLVTGDCGPPSPTAHCWPQLFCAFKNKISEERGVLCFPSKKVRIVNLLPVLFKTMLFYFEDARRAYKHN